MIDFHTGEVSFTHEVCFKPHMLFMAHTPPRHNSHSLPVQGWQQHKMGLLHSEFGQFQIEVTTDSEHRIEAIFLRHIHSFYKADTPDDSERRAFHEGIIVKDLRGQREFSWGHVFCRLDDKTKIDWLCLVYIPFVSVPLEARAFLHSLQEHNQIP